VNSEKYIGLDVHQATISVAVLDETGKLSMECILETKAATMVEFFAGLRGTLAVTFEEGTSAGWLYDLLRPHVARLVVCNPRKNALLKAGNKSDRIDARKLAELLRGDYLESVYHGETGVRTLRELARSYLTTSKDLTRVMPSALRNGVGSPGKAAIFPAGLSTIWRVKSPRLSLRTTAPLSIAHSRRCCARVHRMRLPCSATGRHCRS